MNDLRLRLLMFAGSVTLITVAFGNCSKVQFAYDEQSSLQRLNVDGEIIINGGAPYTNNVDVSLALSNSTADEMYVTEDPTCQTGGAWEKFAANKPWRLSKNNSQVKVFAKFRERDVKVDSGCFEDGIIHDDIAPVITISKAVSNFINKDQAAIEFKIEESGSGIESQECLLDGAKRVACTAAHIRTGLSEGAHALQIVAVDKAGNFAIPVQSAFVVDLTKPSLVINQSPAKVTGSTAAEFKFTGTDALSGISKYECRNSASSVWEVCTSPRSFSSSEGVQVASFRVYDNAGNVSDDVPYSWTVDLTAPTVKITKTPDAATKDPKGNFEFSGTDNGLPLARYECAVDNVATYAACTSPYMTAALGEGSHTFYVRGYDDVGNVSAPASYSWMIDLTAPTVSILSGPPAVTPLKDATITFLGSDSGSGVDHYECNLNNAGYVKCTSPQVFAALADGTYTVQVIAVDKVGNKSVPASRTFRVDTLKPTIDITKTPLLQTLDRNANFEFTATDPQGAVDFIECSLDSANSFVPCTSPKVYNIIDDGTHTFYVRATDKAGNVSDVKNYSWLLDTKGPVINITSQPPAIITDSNVYNLSFKVTDTGVGVKTVLCKKNNADYLCSDNFSEVVNTAVNGDFTFYIKAEDKLGNISEQMIAWKVDVTVRNVTVALNNKAFVCSPFGDTATQEMAGLKAELRYINSNSTLSNNQKINYLSVDYFKDGDVNVTKFAQTVFLPDVNVPTRSFSSGFKSSDGSILKDDKGQNLIEFFALKMETEIKLGANDLDGYYEFASISDDGIVVQVQVGGVWSTIISNDGPHSSQMKCMNQRIFLDKKSRLPMRIYYNQGPRTEIANVLVWNYRGMASDGSAAAINDATIHTYCGQASGTLYWDVGNNSAVGPWFKAMSENQGWKILKPENFLLPNNEVNPCSFNKYDINPSLTVATMSSSVQTLKYSSTDSTTLDIKIYRVEGANRVLVNSIAKAPESMMHTFDTGPLDPNFQYQLEIVATVAAKSVKVLNLFDLKFQ
jgi:hypothetical protein